MTLLAKIQVWTQPVWLILLFGPFIAVAITHPHSYATFTHFGGNSASGSAFTLVGTGAGMGVILSLIAQIGEQVDYLRFMPDKTKENARGLWTAVLAAGPGWVILGALKQLCGAFLADLSRHKNERHVRHGLTRHFEGGEAVECRHAEVGNNYIGGKA